MPRRRADPLFSIGNQWIAEDPQSPYLYRFWTEPGTGRTRRSSLGTKDLEEAKIIFAEAVLKAAPKGIESPLSIILEHYFVGHTDNLPSKDVARSHGRILLKHFGATARVRQLTDAKQQEFVKSCLEGGLKLAYVARIMTTLSASFSHSSIRDPEIRYTEAAMRKAWKLASSPRRHAYIPTDSECVRLLKAKMPDMLLRWLIIQTMTAGRPQTGVDLAPDQVNRENGIIDLNPADRPQNKKFRPKIRAPRPLLRLLGIWEAKGLSPFGEHYCGYTTMEGVKTALQRLAATTGIPVSTYSFRHKATTVMRRDRVSEDQIAMILGHRRSNVRTTAAYGDWDPDYLKEASAALAQWFWTIRRAARKADADSRDTPEPASLGNTNITN